MSERSDQILKASGLPDPALAVLERADALFVLTASTLLYHDESGTRRVTLRDLARIHSDQEGTLRVETPAGTALSASLVGFDPSQVQTFFRQVRDVTAQAKQLPTVPGSPAAPTPASPAPAPSSAPSPSLAKPADPAPATPPAPRPVVHLPEKPEVQERPQAAPSAAAPSAAAPHASAQGTVIATAAAGTAAAAPASPAPRASAPPPPRRQAGAGSSGQSGQAPASRPAAPKTAPPPPAKAPATPLPVPSGPAPVAAPVPATPAPTPTAPTPAAEAPRALSSGAGAHAELLAQADAVAGLGGRLRLLAVILMLAALGLAYFLYTAETPQPLNALWVVIAGGVGAVALTVLATLTRLLATLAQAVGARENGDG